MKYGFWLNITKYRQKTELKSLPKKNREFQKKTSDSALQLQKENLTQQKM